VEFEGDTGNAVLKHVVEIGGLTLLASSRKSHMGCYSTYSRTFPQMVSDGLRSREKRDD
jgi:hypothetical protein